MQKIYIVNYCSPNCTPCKSITQLTESEAFALAKEISSKNSGRAFNRFGDDFKFYYPDRLRTEKWLYEKFIALGGEPQLQHPFYFVVHGSDLLYERFGKGTVYKNSAG